MDLPPPGAFAVLACAALFAGLSKGGLPGVGNLTPVLAALAIPARESVGVVLPVLIAADVVAVTVYRRHADWRQIGRLAPWVVVGILVGYTVFGRVDDRSVRLLIGSILLAMATVHFTIVRRRKQRGAGITDNRAVAAAAGTTAGFATMVANAAGPVAALYLIAAGLPKYAYIGTAAWFFFLVNCFKIPLMADLGILNGGSLRLSLSLAPFSVAGALCAPLLVRHINQRVFEILIWTFVLIGGLKLVLS